MEKLSFNEQIEQSIKDNWELDALSDYKGETFQYKDIARIIEKLHIIFEYSNVKPGDKIALCGRNSAHWGAVFFATLTYGAVAVPILHEFKADQVHNIVNHSEAKLLFVGDLVWKNLDANEMPNLEGIINIADYSLLVGRTQKVAYAREHLNQLFGERYPMNFRKHHISYYKGAPEELAVINYTSGTTSRSKGVMIPYRALWSNLEFAKEVLSPHMKIGDNVISMLPMAHMYGMAFEFIFEFCTGCHIYFLTKNPSPNVLFAAFAELKPRIIIAVPLIIEKIIRKAVLPKIQGTTVKMLLKVPLVRQKIKDKICEQLKTAFGGNFYEIIIGGAAFNHEIEMLLHDIGFNYTVGYGTTECAPIISYADWNIFAPGSCGKAAPRMEIKIDSNDPQHTVGEILTRGANGMLGYYKNEEATREVFTEDGWLKTGDLGTIDANGFIYIRGRSKTMLLSSNGQNIFPEEIEAKLNNMPFVLESLIIERNKKLVALVYPDYDSLDSLGLNTPDNIKTVMDENLKNLNKLVGNYEQVSTIQLYPTEFEKTPKKSIKRFLYNSIAEE